MRQKILRFRTQTNICGINFTICMLVLCICIVILTNSRDKLSQIWSNRKNVKYKPRENFLLYNNVRGIKHLTYTHMHNIHRP